jgi:hypothetical protein
MHDVNVHNKCHHDAWRRSQHHGAPAEISAAGAFTVRMLIIAWSKSRIACGVEHTCDAVSRRFDGM